MSWTDERVETLKTMWGEGKSASQIAKELGGVTRNAVIGKVHRLGLSNRTGGAGSAPAAAATPPPAPAAPPPEPVKPEPKVAEAAPEPAEKLTIQNAPTISNIVPGPRPQRPIPGQPMPPQPAGAEISEETLANLAEVARKSKRLSLMQLTERTCKWPVGDPATDDFWFCGLPSAPGKPYCETHVSVAFQPMSSRRDRRGGSRS